MNTGWILVLVLLGLIGLLVKYILDARQNSSGEYISIVNSDAAVKILSIFELAVITAWLLNPRFRNRSTLMIYVLAIIVNISALFWANTLSEPVKYIAVSILPIAVILKIFFDHPFYLYRLSLLQLTI